MKDAEIKRICVDCGQEFAVSPNQQMFYKSRGWELPKRCKLCRELKKLEWQKKEAEEAAKKFEAELETSKYTVIKISDIEVSSPATTLYVIGNGFDLAHGVPLSYSKFRDWLGRGRILEKLWKHTSEMMHCGGI